MTETIRRITLAEFVQLKCAYCDSLFIFTEGLKECPLCKNSDEAFLMPMFQKNSLEIESMYSTSDWHGG